MVVSRARALHGLGCLIAASFVFADIEPSHAQGMAPSALTQHGLAVPDGLAAMVQVHIPFGDAKSSPRKKRRGKAPRTVTLSLGTSWRDQTGSPEFTGPRYLSTFEAGLTFDGDPVVRFGVVDLVKTDEEQE